MQGPELIDLTGDLSAHFACPALTAVLHDSDIFYYELFENGISTDQYDSEPTYFDGVFIDSNNTPIPPVPRPYTGPAGGDASRLCNAFGVPEAVPMVDQILHERHDLDARQWVNPYERHVRLAVALHLPAFVTQTGYRDLSSEGGPSGIPSSLFADFVRVPQEKR